MQAPIGISLYIYISSEGFPFAVFTVSVRLFILEGECMDLAIESCTLTPTCAPAHYQACHNQTAARRLSTAFHLSNNTPTVETKHWHTYFRTCFRRSTGHAILSFVQCDYALFSPLLRAIISFVQCDYPLFSPSLCAILSFVQCVYALLSHLLCVILLSGVEHLRQRVYIA